MLYCVWFLLNIYISLPDIYSKIKTKKGQHHPYDCLSLVKSCEKLNKYALCDIINRTSCKVHKNKSLIKSRGVHSCA